MLAGSCVTATTWVCSLTKVSNCTVTPELSGRTHCRLFVPLRQYDATPPAVCTPHACVQPRKLRCWPHTWAVETNEIVKDEYLTPRKGFQNGLPQILTQRHSHIVIYTLWLMSFLTVCCYIHRRTNMIPWL
ncbi:hypothetical protein DFJ58DRAFT_18823 [Suillus subalutaceus]|uniref:uncharacterized protein n=1 Tax=Suillus subalutaceus TaxID=48586 RepID=UPI001B881B67|nr:uncharacterized protein DFJ58DRAFT_18823 [Suillus subalutaceus]KAG1870596.1 hypothetical protein DFJ58DRAFT_18823 [Suillus subalutaceus]